MNCPCGNTKPYTQCCEPYIKGKKKAPTPEALMRSRYTAYTLGNLDYIEQTMRGDALARFDRKEAESNIKNTEWLKLDVLFSEEEEDKGTVQFIATFRFGGEEHFMHEISSFEKVDGKWYYTKGILS